MSFTAKVNSAGQLEIVTTFQSAERQIAAASDAVSYWVVGAFIPAVNANARLEVFGLVSKAGVTMRTQLFDMNAVALLPASLVTITELVDTSKKGATVPLIAGRKYQILVSVQASSPDIDTFGIIRHVTPSE